MSFVETGTPDQPARPEVSQRLRAGAITLGALWEVGCLGSRREVPVFPSCLLSLLCSTSAPRPTKEAASRISTFLTRRPAVAQPSVCVRPVHVAGGRGPSTRGTQSLGGGQGHVWTPVSSPP